MLRPADDCVIISEFPVDESCAAGCGQHPPGRCVLPCPSTTKLPAQGTVRHQYTLTQIAFTYKQKVRNKYRMSRTECQVRVFNVHIQSKLL